MPDLVNQLCHQFNAAATQLERGWQYDLYNTQQELNKEKHISKEFMQKVVSLEEECQMSGNKLQQVQEKNAELEVKLQETETCWSNAENMMNEVNGAIDGLRAELASECGEATAAKDSLSVGETLKVLDRCKALLEVRDSQNSSGGHFQMFKALSNHDVASQKQIQELRRSNEELSKRAEMDNAEILNLKKILEMYTEDSPRRRKTSRRNTV